LRDWITAARQAEVETDQPGLFQHQLLHVGIDHEALVDLLQGQPDAAAEFIQMALQVLQPGRIAGGIQLRRLMAEEIDA
jgi:hypothetical protein